MRSLVPALLFALGPVAFAQSPASDQDPEVFQVIEQTPELIGGVEYLLRRLEAPDGEPMVGEVLVAAILDEQVRVTEARAVGCPLPPAWCAEAVRAVEESRFRPGMARSRPQKYRITIPVLFLAPEADIRVAVADVASRATMDKIIEVRPVLIGGDHELRQRTILPPEAIRLGVGGRVRVRAMVGVDGIARDFRVVRGIDREGLTDAQRDAADRIERNAISAVAGSRFVPGSVDGEPTPMSLALTLHFSP